MTFGDIIDRERREAAEEAAREASKETFKKTSIEYISELLEDLGPVPEELHGYFEGIENMNYNVIAL